MENTSIQIMDITTIKAVISEIYPEIIPSRFEKAQQPEANTIQLGFRNLTGLIWLELSWQADVPRIVKISSPEKGGEQSTLAKQIKHGLSLLALVELDQIGFDRVIEFKFAKRPGERIEKSLVLELMGRHSNLFLLDKEKKVITIGKQVREKQSSIRPISTGDLYSPPPKLKGEEPRAQETFSEWKNRLCLIPTYSLKKALQNSYQGISPALAMQIANEKTEEANSLLNLSVNTISEENWEILYLRWNAWIKSIEDSNTFIEFNGPTDYRLWNAEKKTRNHNEISLSLGIYYRKCINEKKINQIIKSIRVRLSKASSRENDLLEKQQKLLEKVGENKHAQRKADKLLSMKSPSKETIIKAQSLYKKAKKQRRSESTLKERINHHKQRLSSINESGSFLNQLNINTWESFDEKFNMLKSINEEIDEYLYTAKGKKRIKKDTETPKPLEIISPNGILIQIGRNHKQNELISIKQARKGDLWFHSQKCPGSHIVLKFSIKEGDDNDIQLAADLAACFSKARGTQIAPIIKARVENLQRLKGAVPGTLSYKKEEVLWGEASRAMQQISSTMYSDDLSSLPNDEFK